MGGESGGIVQNKEVQKTGHLLGGGGGEGGVLSKLKNWSFTI